LVCTEDRFFHRKQNGVKSYCSLVLRQYLILLKQLEEEFQSVFHRYIYKYKQHGFARNRMWIIVQNPPPLPNESNAKPHIDLLLKTSEDDLKIWPHSFEFRLRVSLAAEGYLSASFMFHVAYLCLACEGLKPFCAIYSSFMQRAYDQ
ncbi:hypothetical protein HN51_069627, partial [Arachis hypogaea]